MYLFILKNVELMLSNNQFDNNINILINVLKFAFVVLIILRITENVYFLPTKVQTNSNMPEKTSSNMMIFRHFIGTSNPRIKSVPLFILKLN